MTQLSSKQIARLGRVFPEKQLSLEEKARRKDKNKEFYQLEGDEFTILVLGEDEIENILLGVY